MSKNEKYEMHTFFTRAILHNLVKIKLKERLANFYLKRDSIDHHLKTVWCFQNTFHDFKVKKIRFIHTGFSIVIPKYPSRTVLLSVDMCVWALRTQSDRKWKKRGIDCLAVAMESVDVVNNKKTQKQQKHKESQKSRNILKYFEASRKISKHLKKSQNRRKMQNM